MDSVKVKVKCNQTGKIFGATSSRLVNEDCNPLSADKLEEGNNVYWEDEDMDAYPATIVKLIGESEHTNSIVLVI